MKEDFVDITMGLVTSHVLTLKLLDHLNVVPLEQSRNVFQNHLKQLPDTLQKQVLEGVVRLLDSKGPPSPEELRRQFRLVETPDDDEE